MEQTLLLNVSYEPLAIVHWTRAMTLLAKGAVEIVAESEIEKRAVSFTFKLPAVARLLRFIRTRARKEHVPFTRANIFRRDEYVCAYCEQEFASEDLTYGHVIPASQGGPKTWENIVTACVPCNRKKGARTPEAAGLTLRRRPRKPLASPILRVSIGIRKTPELWRNFLYWHSELES